MEIQLSIFLIVYIIFLGLFLFFTFFNVYYLIKFGFAGFWGSVITISYLAMSAAGLIISYFLLSPVDWSAPLASFNDSGAIDLFIE